MPQGHFRVAFATSFAPPQKLTTSFLVKFVVSLVAEFTSVPDPAPGFTSLEHRSCPLFQI